MRRWGDADRFLERIARSARVEPDATFRSSFILGYPGETEDDQRVLLEFIDAAQLDWAGFFTFSSEEGTYANDLDAPGPHELALERLREVSELQDTITARSATPWWARASDSSSTRRASGAACASAPRLMAL
jgi:ribosomal protein S12 methylthiotransferase